MRDIKDVLLGDAEAVRDRAKSLKPRTQTTDWTPLLVLGLFIVIFFWIAYHEQRQAQNFPASAQRRRQGRQGPIIVPGGWGGSGGWSGGSSSSNDSGGGFSGGGGDFGGGGASGSW